MLCVKEGCLSTDIDIYIRGGTCRGKGVANVDDSSE